MNHGLEDGHLSALMVQLPIGSTVRRDEAIDQATQGTRADLAERLGIKTPEQIATINKIASQYDSSVATWSTLGIPTDGIQTKAEVTTWLNTLPGKTLENLAAYGEIRLKFIPPVKTLELPGAHCHEDVKDVWSHVGAEGWEFGLTVETENMSPNPEIYYVNGVDDKNGTRNNEEMVNLYERKYQTEGLNLMPQKAYIPSLLDARNRKVPFDRVSSTYFKSQEGDTRLPRGEIDLSWSYTGGSDKDLRCRPWLQGKVISSQTSPSGTL